MPHRTSPEFNQFISQKLTTAGGYASVVSQDTGISLNDLIFTILYLRGADYTESSPDISFPFLWEPTDQHITILRKFYVDSGFLKERICFLFNLNRSTSAIFFKRVLGVTRVQGNAWRSPAKQEAKNLLLIDMVEAYNRVYGVWCNTHNPKPSTNIIRRILRKVFG